MTPLRNYAPVRTWLWVATLMIAAMVIVGGATRLTESGLSITEWDPVTGVLPPIGAEQWQAEFGKYRQTTQYQELNHGMSLGEFQYIYYWEWAHRLLGRTIGLVFALPLLFFWLRGYVDRSLGKKLLVVFLLGGVQGAIGWWMVVSGLAGRVSVAPYRLAIHLTFAFFLFATLVWIATSLRDRLDPRGEPGGTTGAWIVLGVAFLQVFLGAIVAGLRAGTSFNTWPLMDGAFIPPTASLGVLEPLWRNLFENPMTAQFAHRMVAYALLAVAGLYAFSQRGCGIREVPSAGVIFLAVAAQAMLGILTLINVVPIELALLHQFGALVVVGLATAHLQGRVRGRASQPASAVAVVSGQG